MENIYELINNKVVICAEIGINHNGNLQTAKDMILAAKECGVDAVKFQGFKTEDMYSKLTPGFAHTENNVFEQIKQLEIQKEWWAELKELAKANNLFFSCSIFDDSTLNLFKETKLDFVKIASSELDNLTLLEKQMELSDIFVISTGMSYLDEITRTVKYLRSKGLEKIILLECTSSYPAPAESINLFNIDFLKNTFSVPPGFSDHTMGIYHSVAAVARGAKFIEKHFTLDKNMDGPDHKLSADIDELRALVKTIREIEISLKGNQKLSISSYEKEAREIGRKSVIANQSIAKGEIISLENTILKRPGKGIKPDETQFLYGRKAKVNIKNDAWITWNMVE